ncbi:uncharacterized protein LOC125177572 [Hyalella azteca]|uniref:Uncharacterized protein LOC125177572 n=1 Tax=Hyalella azteca TaxID=294128 RepID=A0A979FEZ8_HYAAZ|nr:uncharacterized protein LOC125177572 [Hyalella azteca]
MEDHSTTVARRHSQTARSHNPYSAPRPSLYFRVVFLNENVHVTANIHGYYTFKCFRTGAILHMLTYEVDNCFRDIIVGRVGRAQCGDVVCTLAADGVNPILIEHASGDSMTILYWEMCKIYVARPGVKNEGHGVENY